MELKSVLKGCTVIQLLVPVLLLLLLFQILAHVLMVLKQLGRRVLRTMPIFVRLVQMATTKLVTRALLLQGLVPMVL